MTRLAHVENVRRHAEVLAGEPLAGLAEAGLDFVEDQDNAVLVAQRAHAFEIALGRHGVTAVAARQRVHQDRRDGVGTLGDDDPLELLEARQTASGMTEFHIPETVTAIGDNAFGNCRNLRRITLPSGLKELGSETFAGDTELTVAIPGGRILAGCVSVTRAEIAEGVTAVEEGALLLGV